jgi:hypothetical protein
LIGRDLGWTAKARTRALTLSRPSGLVSAQYSSIAVSIPKSSWLHALITFPSRVMAQQPSAMQGQAPAADTGKATAKAKSKKAKKHGKKPAAKPEAKDSTKMKP